ncbi:MAG: hypothetical protein WCX65_16170 [bacterium]
MSYLIPKTEFEKKVKAVTDKCMVKNYDKHSELNGVGPTKQKEISEQIFKRESERIAKILMMTNRS